MTRKYAVVPTALWDDESFCSLTPSAKFVYVMLLSQGDLDAGGILALRERRWAWMTGLPVPQVQACLAELDVAGWAFSDDDVQEVYVSGFFEFERIHKQPRYLVAAWEAIGELCSARLSGIAAAELSALVTGTDCPVPRGIRAQALERGGYRCAECGWKPGDPVPLKRGTSRPVFRVLEVDHIYPRSKGGADHLGNYQVLCTTCNCRKGARVQCP